MSLVSSLLNIVVEVYLIFRTLFLLVPSFLRPTHKIRALMDIRLGRASSLLLLDLLTIVPSAMRLNLAADFIPFSISVIIVLSTYNLELLPHDFKQYLQSRLIITKLEQMKCYQGWTLFPAPGCFEYIVVDQYLKPTLLVPTRFYSPELPLRFMIVLAESST